MSKPIPIRAFWDPIVGRETLTNSSVKTAGEVINELIEKVELLEKQVKDLQTAYMEEKLLGKEPGKIGE